MDFIDYLKNVFFNIPTNFDDFIASPYVTLYYIFLLILLLTGKIRLFLKTIFLTFLFFLGFYYSMINPIGGNNILNIVIFSSTLLIVLIILLLSFITKGN